MPIRSGWRDWSPLAHPPIAIECESQAARDHEFCSEKRSRLDVEEKLHIPHSEDRGFNGLIVPDQSCPRITTPEPGLQRQILAYTPTLMETIPE